MFNQVKQVTRHCMLSCPSAHSNPVSLSLVLNLSFGSASVTQQFSKHICRSYTESSQLAWLHNAYPNKLERGRQWLPTLLISHHCIQCEARMTGLANMQPAGQMLLCNIIPTWLVISREKLAAEILAGFVQPVLVGCCPYPCNGKPMQILVGQGCQRDHVPQPDTFER